MSVPKTEPLPPRLSTITDCPKANPSRSDSNRATVSADPPAAKGTMNLMGL
jgi:hypothetical protein